MAVTSFDHVNVLTDDIKKTRDFFVAVLGVAEGPRPPFRSPGYWLYQGDTAIIHISDTSNHEQTHVGGGTHSDAAQQGRGGVDHIAFRCAGYGEMKQRLRELGIVSHEADVPGAGLRQVFVDGPNNVTLELIFTAADLVAASEHSARQPEHAAR
jgi:catechol 2,3-dioxygenase-like lactoylglutathione lyase family enzyme